jgi:hypothetical protein
MRIFMDDRTSPAHWTSMRFLSSFMNYKPVVLPEGSQGARFFWRTWEGPLDSFALGWIVLEES